MRVKKYLALTLAAALATCLLTACPWDIEDDAASSPSSVPSSSSRPSHDGGSSDNDNDSSSAPSSPSTPDEPEIKVDASGALQLPEDTTSLSAEDIEDIKGQIVTVELDGVTVEQGTFAGCNSLTTVTLSNVTINGFGTFGNCQKLETVTLSNITIENDVKSTFYLCRELTTVTGADELTTIPHSMFSGCSSLPYIDISKATSIGNSAFAGCTSLTAVDASGATSIGQSAFFCCNSLKNIRVGKGLTSIDQSAFKVIDLNTGNTIQTKLTVHCMGSAEDENLKDLFVANNVGSYAEGYPKFEYGCDETCWNQIVSQNQPTAPDTGNALAQYLLDLRL